MKISKIRNVKTPTRGTKKSAGLDFYIPEDFKQTTMITGDSVFIPSGIKAEVPTGYMLVAFNKSGVATKLGLHVGACVVDEDYQGEIHIHLTKTSGKRILLVPGLKIVQFILIPVKYEEVEVVDIENLYIRDSERKDGGFGSTGIK